MAQTDFSGPVVSTAGFGVGGTAGTAVTTGQLLKQTTAIADSTATTVCTVTIPNANQSAVGLIRICSSITNASHTYDSTRVVMYTFTVTRVAGAATVLALSSAIGAQIATSAGGQTLTTALSAAAVAGANTATQTIALQITNVNASAGTTQTMVNVEWDNVAGTAPSATTFLNTGANPAPTGVTVS